MSDELETAKQIATHPLSLTSMVGMIGWLANKVYRGHRHEIANLKQSDTEQGQALAALAQKLDTHALRDEDSFRELALTMARNHTEILTHLLELKK